MLEPEEEGPGYADDDYNRLSSMEDIHTATNIPYIVRSLTRNYIALVV